jgi:methylmalonyl-CoA mutase C-terminal domain/subunit
MSDRKIRVLICKPGLDGHDRGAKVVAAALRDAGMEVVYTGLRQTPEMVVETAIQEDVDAMTIFPKVLKLLRKRGADHVLLTGGGIIPDEDRAELEAMGVGRLFGPGATSEEYVKYLTAEVHRRRQSART